MQSRTGLEAALAGGKLVLDLPPRHPMPTVRVLTPGDWEMEPVEADDLPPRFRSVPGGFAVEPFMNTTQLRFA